MKWFRYFLLCAVLLLASCEQESIVEADKASVRITTRALTDALDYPLHVFAFDGEGQLASSLSLASAEEEDRQLSLLQGKPYHIVVVSGGTDAYAIPTSPSLSSVISFPESDGQCVGYATRTPLQMGFADITPTTANSVLDVQLYYRVASLRVSLSDLPEQTASASVTVSGCCSGLSMAGEGQSLQTVQIPCRQVEGCWQTDEVFVLPGNVPQTTFTIAYTDGEGEQYASATYHHALSAGTPYALNGTYDAGSVNVSGTVTPATWNDPVNFTFSFKDDQHVTLNDNGDHTDVPTDGTEYTVTSLPTSGSVWNGHVVAMANATSSTTATLTLLSLTDWSDMTSSTNAATPTKALDTAAAYTEGDLVGWTIPTIEQAKALSSSYEGTPLADAIKQANGDPIVLMDSSKKNVRYLCDEATKTYSFAPSSILSAGATVETYHLRLVKTVKVKVSE